jgi:hypothetical protein
MRRAHAVDLGLHGAKLVGELGGALLLGPECAQLASHVVQLGPGASQLLLHRIHGIARVERLELCGVQLLLKLPRALRLSLEGVQLLDRHRELRLRSLELRPKSHGLGFDLLQLIPAGAGGRVASGQELTRDPVTFHRHAVQPLLERPRRRLCLDRPFLELTTLPGRLIPHRPLRRLQLVEGGAVLILQDVQALLRLLRALLGAPASFCLFLHPRPRCLDPSRRFCLTARDHGHPHPHGLRGLHGVRAAKHRCAGGEQDEDERASEEEHVRSPRRGRARDVVRRPRQLHGGGAADSRREAQPDEHGQGVVDEPGLGFPPERGADAPTFAHESLADVPVLGREEDLPRSGEQGHGFEVAGVEHDVVDRTRQLPDPLRGRIVLEIVRAEHEREGTVRDHLCLFDRSILGSVACPDAHPEGTRHSDDEQRDERDVNPSS